MFVEERLYRPPEDSPGVHRETPWENKLILEGNKIFTLTGKTFITKLERKHT